MIAFHVHPATKRTETEIARVELYNLCERGRAVGNGWYVARYLVSEDGSSRRADTLRNYGRDEGVARLFAAWWNARSVCMCGSRARQEPGHDGLERCPVCGCH